MSRTLNTIKNTSLGLIAQLITICINFINRTIFIYFLGAEYLGLSGLFSNILSMLSLAELGIGVAISFSLYKPLSENDIRKTKALMNFYQLAYRIIGTVILALGLCLIPFLNVLIKERPAIPYFELIYILFLANTVISYFFTYKRSLLSADQKEYINTINRTVFAIIQSVGQFFVLLIFKNYLMYLLVVIVCTLLSNIRISHQCNKLYPYLKDNEEKLTPKETGVLIKYVGAQLSHKVGGIVVSGTDNILTTALVCNGLIIVGLYSNYLLLINTIRSIITMFFTSVTASVGNLNAEGDTEKSKGIFNKMFFLNMCFYGITSSCVFNLANDFINIWVGKEYLLSSVIVLIMVTNYYMTGMRQTCITFNTTLGLFWNDRFKPWIEAIINLLASIMLIRHFGFAGVLLGTLVSTLTTSFWVEPYILYKHGFEKKLVDYFARYLQYTLTTIFAAVISNMLTKFIIVTSIWLWLIKAVVVLAISTIVVVVIFKEKDEFRGLEIIAESIIKNCLKK